MSAEFAPESIYNPDNTLVEVDMLKKEVLEIYDKARCCILEDEGA